jgi:hypothetical protein
MSAAQAAEFREDVLLFGDWAVDDYNLSESLAALIELEAASYDSQMRIVLLSLPSVEELLATEGG